jgi:hypothetical protein
MAASTLGIAFLSFPATETWLFPHWDSVSTSASPHWDGVSSSSVEGGDNSSESEELGNESSLEHSDDSSSLLAGCDEATEPSSTDAEIVDRRRGKLRRNTRPTWNCKKMKRDLLKEKIRNNENTNLTKQNLTWMKFWHNTKNEPSFSTRKNDYKNKFLKRNNDQQQTQGCSGATKRARAN